MTTERESSDLCSSEVLSFTCPSTTLKNCTIKDVIGDGNCGVWTLMQALNPSEDFLQLNRSQRTRMKALRTAVASKTPDTAQDRIKTCAINSTDQAHWITTDDFRYFAQLP